MSLSQLPSSEISGINPLNDPLTESLDFVGGGVISVRSVDRPGARLVQGDRDKKPEPVIPPKPVRPTKPPVTPTEPDTGKPSGNIVDQKFIDNRIIQTENRELLELIKTQNGLLQILIKQNSERKPDEIDPKIAEAFASIVAELRSLKEELGKQRGGVHIDSHGGPIAVNAPMTGAGNLSMGDNKVINNQQTGDITGDQMIDSEKYEGFGRAPAPEMPPVVVPAPLPEAPPVVEPAPPVVTAPPEEVRPETIRKDEDGDKTVAPPQEEDHVEPIPPVLPHPEPTPLPEETLPEELTVVIAGDTHHIADEERKGVSFQMKLGQELNQSAGGMPGRSIKNILSGIYQRTFLQPVFEEREARWRRVVLAKTGLADLPNELVEEAMKKGKGEFRNRRNPFRRVIDRIYNFGANLIGANTTDYIDAQKWLIEEVNKAKNGQPTAVVEKLKKADGAASMNVSELFLKETKVKEGFAARLMHVANGQAESYKGEVLGEITDPYLKKQLVQDMFRILTPYINGTMTEEQALRIMELYADGGYQIGEETLRLRNRLSANDYAYLRNQLTTLGQTMRKVAQVYSQKDRAGQVNLYQKLGKVDDAASADAWIRAYDEGKIRIKFVAAQGEMTPGGRRETLLESTARRLEGRPVGKIFPQIEPAANWLIRMGMSLGLNEVTAAHLGGYGLHFLESFIPTSSSKVALGAGVVGLPAIPVLIATTTVGLPIALPLAAGAAISAGVFAGIREVVRIRREAKSVEWEESVGIVDQDIRVNPGPIHKFFKFFYGATERKTLVEKIAHQRDASEVLKGLVRESHLFQIPSEANQDVDLRKPLTPEMIQNMRAEQVQTALRWYNEYKARSNSEIDKNRRFFKWGKQFSETEKREVLAVSTHEVYERLTVVFQQREDLRNQFFVQGVNNIGELCNKLEESYRFNLLGSGVIFGRQKASNEATQLVNLLGANDAAKGLITSSESLASRNRAMNRLSIRGFGHRAAGTAITAMAWGDLWAEAKHHLAGTPPSWLIGSKLFGEAQEIQTPGAGPGAEFAFNDVQHLRLPTGFVRGPFTNIVHSPVGSTFDLNNFKEVNGNLNIKDLSDYLHGRYGVDQLSPNQADIFTQPTHTNEFKFNGGETIIKTPGEVSILDQDHNNLIDHISLKKPDGSIDTFDVKKELGLAEDLNPADKADLVKLQAFLDKKGLEFKILKGGSSIQEELVNSPVEKKIPLSDVWEKLVHKIDRRQWYSYDQEGAQWNELRLYSYRDRDAVILDMSKMKEAYQQGLPSPIYVDQLIANQDDRLGFYISLPGKSNLGVFIRDSVDGKIDGMIRFDPNDSIPAHMLTLNDGSKITLGEFSKMILNANELKNATGSTMPNGWTNIGTEFYRQRGVFNFKWAEAGIMNDVGGKAEFDAFATIGGEHKGFTGEIIRRITEKFTRYTMEAVSDKYDIYKFEIPAVTKPGEFVIGVMPAPYTEYAQLGKYPEAAARTPEIIVGQPERAARPTGTPPTQTRQPRILTEPVMQPEEMVQHLGISEREVTPELRQVMQRMEEALRNHNYQEFERAGLDYMRIREKEISARELADLQNEIQDRIEVEQRRARPRSPPPPITPTSEAENRVSLGTENAELRSKLKNIYDNFYNLAEKGEIEQEIFSTADKYYWQSILYGSEREQDGDKCYRGYLMIEPNDFPKALEILSKIGEDRKKEGKRLEFKWLLFTYPSPDKFVEYLQDYNKLGSFDELDPTDSRIVIYGDTLNEVQEILKTIAEDERYKGDWLKVEQNRINKFGGRKQNAPRRSGTNAYITPFTGELRSLNYNNKPGYSEFEAADPDWRSIKVGDKTVRAGDLKI